MKGRLVGLALLTSLAAACSSPSTPSVPAPKPTPATTQSITAAAIVVIHAYGDTVNAALPQVTQVAAQLRQCGVPTECLHVATAASGVASTLLHRLGSDDELRQATTSGELAPGVSPVVILSEGDAAKIKRTVKALTAHSSKADVAKLGALINRLETELKRWRLVHVPGG